MKLISFIFFSLAFLILFTFAFPLSIQSVSFTALLIAVLRFYMIPQALKFRLNHHSSDAHSHFDQHQQ